jgi:hypothetical protein
MNIWFRLPFTLYWIGTEIIFTSEWYKKDKKYLALYRKEFIQGTGKYIFKII